MTEADIINEFLKKKIVELTIELARARVGDDGMIRYQMKLEEENSALREQLRLANIDASNLEAELADLRWLSYE